MTTGKPTIPRCLNFKLFPKNPFKVIGDSEY